MTERQQVGAGRGRGRGQDRERENAKEHSPRSRADGTAGQGSRLLQEFSREITVVGTWMLTEGKEKRVFKNYLGDGRGKATLFQQA